MQRLAQILGEGDMLLSCRGFGVGQLRCKVLAPSPSTRVTLGKNLNHLWTSFYNISILLLLGTNQLSIKVSASVFHCSSSSKEKWGSSQEPHSQKDKGRCLQPVTPDSGEGIGV